MAININAKTTGVGGLETSADNSGNINIQSGGSTVMSVTSSGVAVTGSFSQNGAVYSTQPTFRNLIINGDMKIDQRNAGGSVTPTGDSYTLDRWKAWMTNASKFSVQQNAGSVTPPAGFKNYLGITSLAATTPAAGDYYIIEHPIEGLNVSQLAFGTASAKTVTLSFWVRSSLTGTFSGTLNNSGFNRSYPFTYTISSANTWEQKSITISGDTTGTWLTTNGVGLGVWFSLGVGSNYTGTANTWGGANYLSATGATSLVGTSGATLYITGVQLEVGSTATEFEHLPYDVELARCQRYYENNGGGQNSIWSGYCTSGNTYYLGIPFKVTKRATPSCTFTSIGVSSFPTTGGINNVNTFGLIQYRTANGTNTQGLFQSSITADAEL